VDNFIIRGKSLCLTHHCYKSETMVKCHDLFTFFNLPVIHQGRHLLRLHHPLILGVCQRVQDSKTGPNYGRKMRRRYYRCNAFVNFQVIRGMLLRRGIISARAYLIYVLRIYATPPADVAALCTRMFIIIIINHSQ
jgi:hypothetical protein